MKVFSKTMDFDLTVLIEHLKWKSNTQTCGTNHDSSAV